MLGEKRSNALFENAIEPDLLKINPEKIIGETILESNKSHEKKSLDFEQKSHGLFHIQNENLEYNEVLKQVQEFMSENYSEIMAGNIIDNKDHLKRYISKFINNQTNH